MKLSRIALVLIAIISLLLSSIDYGNAEHLRSTGIITDPGCSDCMMAQKIESCREQWHALLTGPSSCAVADKKLWYLGIHEG